MCSATSRNQTVLGPHCRHSRREVSVCEAPRVTIAEDIQRRTGRGVRRANVFTALQRLEERGLIATRLGAPRAERRTA